MVVTSLKNDEAVKEVYAQLFAADAGRETTFVDMSTVCPASLINAN